MRQTDDRVRNRKRRKEKGEGREGGQGIVHPQESREACHAAAAGMTEGLKNHSREDNDRDPAVYP